MPALKHLRAVLALPFSAIVIVPVILLSVARPARFGWELPPPIGLVAVVASAALIGGGIALMVWTNLLFDRIGGGTLAPWDPTRRLVVHGVYRHVRNPMITGVFCILLAEAVLFASAPLLLWFVAFVCVNLLYIPLVEERSLEARFGDEYRAYKTHVPRWIPRRRAWTTEVEAWGRDRVSRD